MKAAKAVSAALLAGEPVGFYSEFPLDRKGLPEGLRRAVRKTHQDTGSIGIAVTIHPTCKPFTSTVQVVPRVVTLGMGCREEQRSRCN